jgi:hypothetical protein
MNDGLCECGCGNPTRIAPYSCKRDGWIKGKPIRFIKGHYFRLTPSGAENHNWKGGRRYNPPSGIWIYMPSHPRNNRGYVLEHVLIVEKALGHSLPNGSPIHHVDGNNVNNQNHNLVVCQDSSYHKLIHFRMRALKACGCASWRMCIYCKNWDAPNNLKFLERYGRSYHKICARENSNKEYHKRHPGSAYRMRRR